MQVVILLLLVFCAPAFAKSPLKPFKTDGCSWFLDGTLNERRLWRNCCVAHDRTYWQGGTRAQRKAADRKLKSCVATVGKPGVSKLMYLGVRVGGHPLNPLYFRWGYGWKYRAKHKALTIEELELVARTLAGKAT